MLDIIKKYKEEYFLKAVMKQKIFNATLISDLHPEKLTRLMSRSYGLNPDAAWIYVKFERKLMLENK